MSTSAGTLHVCNGDAVVYLFKKAGLLGTHVAWRDVLHEGPVPPGPLEATSAVRVRYLIERRLGRPIKIFRDFEQRDASLRSADRASEVVLWFEHDLFDQLQLLQILVTLDEMRLEPGRVSLVQTDEYLGSMTVEELSALYPRRKLVTAATISAARRAWAAFTGDDPRALFELTKTQAIGLPHMRAALTRLCEEFPWVRDGLSRAERGALQAVAHGRGRIEELFRRAQGREEASFMGQRAFAALVREMGAEPAPLIEEEEGAAVATALGRRVLAGDANWLESRPIDRWIGGMHLEEHGCARWNDETAALEA